MGGLEGKTYVDEKGCMYRVLPSLAGSNFTTMYCMPDRAGWHTVKTMPWRKTREKAQRDLDELAKKKGWKEH